ncbi:inositol 2-dehydrogenase [Flavilitoribacter nigricans]|uniref:Inositol 2-dehydrogenase n=1 Tax=Flavilitoribacter nigricans (strain ATCC 23147 / DSM 23189 / NBRC 102662 / NCIMB 1420 / SS-2) TaxID=1122177 RepID=A0A2D0NBP2_FLAN2|nr:inositol 2-dehydrogenase [Flavilitoribacter nigricans]PHN05599.1 inositol 2-dehydrogenase [Flavilitoribacter nigricans DSM 23189 = NBRC 102662]
MKAFKVAVLGLGRIGQIHAKNLQQLFPDLSLQVITSSDTGRNFAEKNHFPEIGDDFERSLQDPGVKAVVICSPSDTHAHYIKRSAAAGKAIFCEKPLDLSLEVIREIDEAVRTAGVPLMLGFNKRFDPHLGALKRSLQAGKIGRPNILRITSRDPAPPPISYIESSGGIYMDMIIHDFDTSRFLLESEVTSIFTRAAVRVDPAIGEAGDVDTSVSILTFENGVMATIDNSRQAAYGYDQRVEILGSDGMLQMNNIPVDTHLVFGRQGASQPPYLDFFLERYAAAYREEMRVFIEALRQGHAMPVGVEDGLRSTAIAIAAKRSLDENRPVEMKEIL